MRGPRIRHVERNDLDIDELLYLQRNYRHLRLAYSVARLFYFSECSTKLHEDILVRHTQEIEARAPVWKLQVRMKIASELENFHRRIHHDGRGRIIRKQQSLYPLLQILIERTGFCD